MTKYKLSFLIPARNEMFLSRTVQNLLENTEAEIIVGLDGAWAEPPIEQNERVTVVYYSESIGQRAMTNQLCKLSTAKYIAKIDAHCIVDKDMDKKMIKVFEEEGENIVVAPTMNNLHAFDWVCVTCDWREYQSPTPEHCPRCKSAVEKDIIFKKRNSPNSTSFCFDSEPHFQYFTKKNQKGDIVESMSLQGSFFMCTRKKYWELDICSEDFGSWGSQGIEVACKFWLSGGRVLINKRTWYAHMFRTQGGDFSFPYELSGKQVSKAKKHAKNLFYNNEWDKQYRNLSWLLDKFGVDLIKENRWTQEEIEEVRKNDKDFNEKGIIFYTDNQLNLKIAHKVQNRLRKIGLPIVSASLKEMSFGDNIVIDKERGLEAYYEQILKALKNSTTKYVFFCEHDVLYNDTHFDFTPERDDTFYFNTNVWKVDWETRKAVWTDDLQQVSGMVCNRELAINFYENVKKDRHFEPTGRRENYMSEKPIFCIRHDNNLTKTKWSADEFKNPKYAKGFKTVDYIYIG